MRELHFLHRTPVTIALGPVSSRFIQHPLPLSTTNFNTPTMSLPLVYAPPLWHSSFQSLQSHRTNPPYSCVVGVGQIGTPICNALLREKLARLTVVSRSRNADNEATLNDLESKGAALEFCGSYDNVAELTRIFQGADTVLISTRVNVEIIRGTMPHFLAAAVAANVKRFVPCEFGVNTQWVEKGAATIFDAKKEFANAVMASGLGWYVPQTTATATIVHVSIIIIIIIISGPCSSPAATCTTTCRATRCTPPPPSIPTHHLIGSTGP